MASSTVYRKIDLRLIPLLFLCYVLAYLDRVNVSFARLQMSGDLSLDNAAFATGAGLFFIGYFIFETPSNLILKKVGARIWISRIMVTWGIISTGTAFIQNEQQFYVMRFLLGAAEAGFFPGIIYYLTLWYPSRLRAVRMAWFASAVPMAGVIGNPLSGAIMELLSGSGGMEGWQWLFLIEGAPSVVVGFVVLARLDDSVNGAGWLTVQERSAVAAAVEAEETAKPAHRLRDALADRRVYVLSLIYFTLAIGLYSFTFWLPAIVEAFGGLDYWTVGLLTAVPYAAAAAGMVILSRSSDRTGKRRLHFAASLSAGALGLALSGAFAGSPAASMCFLTVSAVGLIAAIPLFWPMPQSLLAGAASAGGIAVVNSLGNLGGYVGPNIMVWARLISPDPSAGLYATAAILLAGAALTLAATGPELLSPGPRGGAGAEPSYGARYLSEKHSGPRQ